MCLAPWAIYSGLFSAVLLIAVSPIVSGAATSLIPLDSGIALNWFPLTNPGMVSIPFGFLMGFIGPKTTNERN